ncbi:YggT family protein [Halobacteriovorax sp. GB3]|uniref:YggT family protein n=1 Tax=Halobacteriovorax sp. GB3 TaxID=2719615 RepID=UPI0023624E53|nr:YggT family protein [Halobacteriovorax sp. GB3]MDD0853842.1 YggT family protein [Halobacteriovorax sp. GB3]
MIRALIDLYILILFVDVILSYIPQYRRTVWGLKVKQVSDFTCAPIRRILPQHDLPFDFSPLIVILGLKLIEALW